MTKNGKESSKKSENGYRKKINGAYTYLLRKELKMTKGKENAGEEGTTKNCKDQSKKEIMDERDIPGS